jgi:predicted acetyltransferase
MIRLELPNVKYKDTYINAVKEFIIHGSDNESTDHYFKYTIDYFENNFDSFVQMLLDRINTIPNETRVPGTQFWIINENDEYCGRVSLRHCLNEELSKHAGNIGYDICPSRRRNNYATIALGLCLIEAKKIGLDKVLLTCDDDNIASSKIIEKNGGVMQDKIKSDSGIITRRYWIQLNLE